MRIGRFLYSGFIIIAMVLYCFAGGCKKADDQEGPEVLDRAIDMVFLQTLERVEDSDISKAAWWFEPYYKRLVEKLDKSNSYMIFSIMAGHGNDYAVENLEPFLKTDSGDKLVLVAVGVYGFSHYLHPEARAVLQRVETSHGAAGWSLNLPPMIAERADESGREAAGVPKEIWKTLTPDEKWERLQLQWKRRSEGLGEAEIQLEEDSVQEENEELR